MDTNNVSDDEILMLINEGTEEANELIFNKYKNIFDILYAKYSSIFYKISVDKQEAYAEALYAFNESLSNYDNNKNSSFPTFLTLCIRRRYAKLIRKHNTEKSKFNNEVYSLDYVYDSVGIPLIDTISTNKCDPLKLISDDEEIEILNSKICEILSTFEYEVYEYMIDGLSYVDIATLMNKNPKQIDNAIQRIKLKIKEIL